MTTMQPTLDDVWQLFKETDRIIKELSASQKELSASQKETDLKFKETERYLKTVGDKIDKLGSRLGDFVEDAVRPAAVRLFRERGIVVHEVHQNVSAQRDGEGIEVDLLVVNDMDAVAIECKSKLTLEDVKEHLERMDKLKRLLPKYASSRVLGAVAAMVVPDAAAKYAYRQGLFVIGQSGEQLLIRNDAKFIPKAW
jgi:hypothetical protein